VSAAFCRPFLGVVKGELATTARHRRGHPSGHGESRRDALGRYLPRTRATPAGRRVHQNQGGPLQSASASAITRTLTNALRRVSAEGVRCPAKVRIP
jgi:hypothetical protein